jgi:thiazole synthase
MAKDTFTLGGKEFSSRFILGSGKYSMELIKAAVENAGAQIITLAVRRTNTKKKESILDFIPEGVTLLPNTSGARDAKEAVRIARMARELGCGDFVKVEIMKDSKYLLPDNVETVKATEMLANEGFVVLPYMYPDLYTARDLVNAGAAAVMPLASPIGSNKGLATKEFIQILIDEIDLPVIVDAGIGRPSQARRWRWGQQLLWQIPRSPQPVMFRRWLALLKMRLKPEEVRTLQDSDACLSVARQHRIR